jgi:putative Mg2+ transporter-C (MgtC) family protein
MAGLRTNALVALGACGFVVFSGLVGQGDPTRVAAQMVTGIGFLGAGVILREGVNVHGLNTAATLWCSAMVGTLAGAGLLGPSVLADAETYYTVEITCRGAEEAHMRSLLLQALTHAGLGLRRLDSEDIVDTSKVTVTAQAVAAKRNDAALEQIVGRLSLEPNVSAAAWQIDRSIPEA